MISKHMILHKKKSIKITKVALSPIESSILEEIAREEKSVETQNPYRVLSSQRKYGIDNDVGLDHFSLQRFQKKQQKQRNQRGAKTQYNTTYTFTGNIMLFIPRCGENDSNDIKLFKITKQKKWSFQQKR